MCIVMLDANEAVEDKEGSLRRIFKSTNLVDVFELHTGRKCEIPTYTRGTKRIDFILASYNLLSYAKKVGYIVFYDASESDHRGAFIELSNGIIDNKN
jgi:exonuclease III